MHKTFLLVDDDSDDRELFMAALQNVAPAFNCICFKNGSEAIQHLKTSEPVDLVFLDLNMPIMDGWECIKRLKQDDHLKEIPVVIYTTSSNERDIIQAKTLGAKCFFIKPDDFTTLNNVLRMITEKLDENCFGKLVRSREQRHLECFC